MKWNMNLDGRSSSDIAAEKLAKYPTQPPGNPEQWLTLAALALEVIGIRRAVRLGDQRLWRQAVAELNSASLPPPHLPLVLWEAYQTAPFSGVKLALADGREIAVKNWAYLFFCWHDQSLALYVEETNQILFADALEVMSAVPDAPSADQVAIRDRLRWLQRSSQFVPFTLRTGDGRGFLVDEPKTFQLDRSGALLALNRGKDGMVVINVADIASVRLVSEQQEQLLEEFAKKLNTSPFTPFQVCFFSGVRWTVLQPQDLFVTKENLFLAEGKPGATTRDRVLSADVSQVDRLEVLPEGK